MILKKKLDSWRKGIFKNITPKSLEEASVICSPIYWPIYPEEVVLQGIF